MLSRLLFASLLGAAVATYTETNKAKGVYNYVVTKYNGDCFTSTVEGYDFKDLGQCVPNSPENPSYYKMGEANATHYIGKRYTDAACTIEKVGAEIDVLPECPGDGSRGKTGNRSETTGTLFIQSWSTSDCSGTPSDAGTYSGGDLCESSGEGSAILKIQGQGGNLKHSKYPSATCTGTASSTQDYVGNGVCTKHPDSAGYYTAWFWHPSDGGVASGAEKLPSPTIPLLVGFAALGRLWTQ